VAQAPECKKAGAATLAFAEVSIQQSHTSKVLGVGSTLTFL